MLITWALPRLGARPRTIRSPAYPGYRSRQFTKRLAKILPSYIPALRPRRPFLLPRPTRPQLPVLPHRRLGRNRSRSSPARQTPTCRHSCCQPTATAIGQSGRHPHHRHRRRHHPRIRIPKFPTHPTTPHGIVHMILRHTPRTRHHPPARIRPCATAPATRPPQFHHRPAPRPRSLRQRLPAAIALFRHRPLTRIHRPDPAFLHTIRRLPQRNRHRPGGRTRTRPREETMRGRPPRNAGPAAGSIMASRSSGTWRFSTSKHRSTRFVLTTHNFF